MNRSDMTSFDLLNLDADEPVNFLEVERRAHKMRAEAVADSLSALTRAVARLFGQGRNAGAGEASL